MAFSPYQGPDGLFHRFTYIKLHIARIYDEPTPPAKRVRYMRTPDGKIVAREG
jgi:hypothetical protein